MSHDARPIGIFDSGIGGLTVTASIVQALRGERLNYFGDNIHIPYGQRSLDQVRELSLAIVGALIGKGCKAIVVACNTASAAALVALRETFPGTPFVGMEPAVKPAVERSITRTVGVIATPATFQSAVYASVIERFAQDVEVLHQPAPGLVELIEAGEFRSARTEEMLRGWIGPMLERKIDALVLGCTHYPLVRPLIEKIAGPGVRVIDPAPAIARQLDRSLTQQDLHCDPHQEGSLICYTSGTTDKFTAMLDALGMKAEAVRSAHWLPDGSLSLP